MSHTSPSFLNQLSPCGQRWLHQQLGPIQHSRQLDGGHHCIWWCQSKRGEFIVRKPHCPERYGTDYQREQQILQALHGASWAINGQFLSIQEPWLIYPFIKGPTLHAASLIQSPMLFTQLIAMLTTLKSLPIPAQKSYQRPMRDYLHHYLALATCAPMPALQQASLWLKSFPKPTNLVLNHHDLSAVNLIVTPQNKLVSLDWEYAALSDQGWDEATLAESFQLTSAQLQQLHLLADISAERFQYYRLASQLLDLCWYSQTPLEQAQIEGWQRWLTRIKQS
ncbi:phosphotransferase [Celerinatantimonas yamalensis]|uniref:Phosphotransferase n=1 Tax=Celerinatantimonas yamalensis TaxID=559956 RepID=A0ABW9G531_9GAMM